MSTYPDQRTVTRRRNDDGEVRGDGLDRARRILLGSLGVEILVLTVTGIALFFLYRPSVSQAWSDVVSDRVEGSVRISQALRVIHLLASRLAVPTAVATGVVLVLQSLTAVRRWVGSATGVGIALTTVAASFTGFLLPWDQVALWAVTVGSESRGYRVLFGDTVRFVLIGGAEVSRGTLLWWLVVHTVVLSPALAVLVALGWRPRRVA